MQAAHLTIRRAVDDVSPLFSYSGRWYDSVNEDPMRPLYANGTFHATHYNASLLWNTQISTRLTHLVLGCLCRFAVPGVCCLPVRCEAVKPCLYRSTPQYGSVLIIWLGRIFGSTRRARRHPERICLKPGAVSRIAFLVDRSNWRPTTHAGCHRFDAERHKRATKPSMVRHRLRRNYCRRRKSIV